jgi:hypothetical protein
MLAIRKKAQEVTIIELFEAYRTYIVHTITIE